MEIVFSGSAQGASHRRRELERTNLLAGRRFPCQDRACARGNLVAADGTRFSFMAVSDGHGGAPYFRSGRGAEIAVAVLQNIVERRMERIRELVAAGDLDNIRSQLALAVTKNWRKRVEEDLAEQPLAEQELKFLEQEKPDVARCYRAGRELHAIYGCTLLGYFATASFWFAIQIGDGDFALSRDGQTFELPMPPDDVCFLNQTTSLCDTSAAKEFRYAAGTEIPKVAFCTSDGVSNSFKTEAQLKNFYRSIFNLFIQSEFTQCQELRCKNRDRCDLSCKEALAAEEIRQYLPHLSKDGSGDDIGLATLIQLDGQDKKRVQALQDYLHGCFVKHNPSAAAESGVPAEQLMFSYFSKAEKGKNPKAKYELALYYYNKADSQLALKKMKAAATDYPEAMVRLADWYLEGYGGSPDPKKARKLYEKAAAAGHKEAATRLSLL